MPRVWRTPSHLNLTKVKSLHPVLEFTFQSSMQTSTCLASWRAFSAQRSGWRPDSVELAGNPEAEPRERLPKRMAGSAEDQGKQLEARTGKIDYGGPLPGLAGQDGCKRCHH